MHVLLAEDGGNRRYPFLCSQHVVKKQKQKNKQKQRIAVIYPSGK